MYLMFIVSITSALALDMILYNLMFFLVLHFVTKKCQTFSVFSQLVNKQFKKKFKNLSSFQNVTSYLAMCNEWFGSIIEYSRSHKHEP